MFFKRFLNIALIILFAISSIGFSSLKGSCGMTENAISWKNLEDNCCFKKESCKCDYQLEYLALEGDFTSFGEKINLPDFQIIATILYFVYNLPVVYELMHNVNIYAPPLLTSDIPVKVQCFRL